MGPIRLTIRQRRMIAIHRDREVWSGLTASSDCDVIVDVLKRSCVMQRTLCSLLFIPLGVSSMAQTNTLYSIVPLESSLNNGHAQVRLSNNGTSAIEAFRFTYTCPNLQMTVTRDPLLHLEAISPILPGAARVINVGGLTTDCSLHESAVLFQDGSTSDDASSIASISDHRAALEEELTVERSILAKAASGTMDEVSLVNYLADQKERISKNIQLSQGARLGHISVIRKLQTSLLPSSDSLPDARGLLLLHEASNFTTRAQTALKIVDEWRLRIEQETSNKDAVINKGTVYRSAVG
jgi:hypothetical protein